MPDINPSQSCPKSREVPLRSERSLRGAGGTDPGASSPGPSGPGSAHRQQSWGRQGPASLMGPAPGTSAGDSSLPGLLSAILSLLAFAEGTAETGGDCREERGEDYGATRRLRQAVGNALSAETQGGTVPHSHQLKEAS